MSIENKPVVFIYCPGCGDSLIIIWIDCEPSEMPSKIYCPNCCTETEEKTLRL